MLHFKGPDTLAGVGYILRSLGDINNDNFDDIAVSSAIPRGVYIFHGGNPIDTFPDAFIKGFSCTSPLDFTSDGIPDLLTSVVYDEGLTNRGVIYLYEGFADSIATIPLDSVSPNLPNYGYGGSPKVGYVDNDSFVDVVFSQNYTAGGPTVLYYNGFYATDTVADWSFKINNYSHYNPIYIFLDFNGDDSLDIVMAVHADLDTISYVYVFEGPIFSPNPDHILSPPSNFTTLDPETFAMGINDVGDVNGDGWDDLSVDYSGLELVYYCGPVFDTLFDLQLPTGFDFFSTTGDLNGDGLNDAVYSRIFAANGDGRVYILLSDSQYDFDFDDQITRSDLPPLYLENIGISVSTAGDFNGDGFCDLMFSARNFAFGEPGHVFVALGSTKLVTDISIEFEPTLPSNFTLSQNYPNPFNPSTTIEFALPTRSHVTLKVLNSLGQEIAVLLNKELSVGSYKVTWDGLDKKGNEVASGVYFYKLMAGDFVETKKMVLVR